MKKLVVLLLLSFSLSSYGIRAEMIDSIFLFPPQAAKPIMIWQWMDGLVTREGITKDLVVFKEAGIGGVQNFQIGGEKQGLISDTTNAVGTDNWKDLMRFSIEECARLGLTYGTHNCPGWSSSAYPTIKPEDSMQKLVWTEKKISGKWYGVMPRPEVDPRYNYYEDIALLAIPDKNIADTVIYLGKSPHVRWEGKGSWTILRIGHTTNGKTNGNTAPHGGVGLEVDKMSKEAVDRYWKTYPSLLLQLAGSNAGKTFCRLEIDSYEAGSQNWTSKMPEEFQKRCGYGLIKWLPVLAGHKVESVAASDKFKKQWNRVIQQLFAENYYGELNRLTNLIPGLKLLIQPYGKPLDPELCVDAAPGSLLCSEFWTHPCEWDGKSVERMSAILHKTGGNDLYAEGMTCWPLYAWKDDPASLKAIADENFLKGVNHLMLHAAASNPWTNVVPGMSFGKWGTQFQPGQTWWSIGAKPLFIYMARCQALLQVGRFYKQGGSDRGLQYLWRKTEGADIIFVANISDKAIVDTLHIGSAYSSAELWYADNGERMTASYSKIGDVVSTSLALDAHGSVFVILRNRHAGFAPFKPLPEFSNTIAKDIVNVATPWKVTFKEPGKKSKEWVVTAINDTLPSWTVNADMDIKYFSGSAIYSTTIKVNARSLKTASDIYLDLGKVKNLAVVRVNGIVCDTLWKSPFIANISKALHKGKNKIDVEVTNLWPNRMIGDEFEPDDMEWSDKIHYEYAQGNPTIGRFLRTVPTWLKENKPRPSSNRRTVTCFKFFTKGSPLLESGLIGTVKLIYCK